MLALISSKPSPQQILILLMLALLVYALAMGILLAISHALRRKKTEDTPYVSQYDRSRRSDK